MELWRCCLLKEPLRCGLLKNLFKEQCLLHLEDGEGTYCKTASQTRENILAVLKSHFNPACIWLFKQFTVFANADSFAQSICRMDLASRRQSMMALGKRRFGFRRFKKHWRALAARAKTQDQNWQSLAYKEQHSEH